MSPADLIRYAYGTASVVELAWTAIGVIGLLVTAQLVVECHRDLAALQKSPIYIPGGAREIVARQNIRTVIQKLALFIAFVGAGLVLCCTPGPGPNPANLSLGFVFVFSEFTLALGSYQDRRDRVALVRILRVRRVDITWDKGQPP